VGELLGAFVVADSEGVNVGESLGLLVLGLLVLGLLAGRRLGLESSEGVADGALLGILAGMSIGDVFGDPVGPLLGVLLGTPRDLFGLVVGN
jgi:hypothetical protein